VPQLNIGRLQRVALREVWKHEAQDFTQWLESNIDVPNEALDLNLLSADRERSAGDFSVDLVAVDQGGGTVVIENQLEKSNHDHLGKLITYLTAMAAKTAIWIVSDPRPEHVAAITWLNESSSANFLIW
jgi:RecB family endonuclease NucS